MDWIDSAYLPRTIARWIAFWLNPHGDADGLILTDGMEVHSPRTCPSSVVAAFKSAIKVKLRGVRAAGIEMIGPRFRWRPPTGSRLSTLVRQTNAMVPSIEEVMLLTRVS